MLIRQKRQILVNAYTETKILRGSVLITALSKDHSPTETNQGAGYGRLLGSSRNTAFPISAKLLLHQQQLG